MFLFHISKRHASVLVRSYNDVCSIAFVQVVNNTCGVNSTTTSVTTGTASLLSRNIAALLALPLGELGTSRITTESTGQALTLPLGQGRWRGRPSPSVGRGRGRPSHRRWAGGGPRISVGPGEGEALTNT